MAIGEKERNKIAIFGAIAGAVTYFLLQWVIMPVLNALGGIIPGISAKLAEGDPTISISVRESLTGIEGGLSGWIAEAFGLAVPTNIVMNLLMAAAGGALMFLLGAYVLDTFNLLKGDAVQKTRRVIFVGNIVAGLILGTVVLPAIGIGLIDLLIAFAINAAILAWVYVAIDKQFKIGLIPF